MANYNDPIIYNWHYNEQTGEKYSVKLNNEQHVITGGKIFLNQIPDKFHGVKINGLVERDLIQTAEHFKVDYTNGMITFQKAKEGQTVTISEYYGRGVISYPASRIWTKQGNMGEIIETLDGVLQALGSTATIKAEIEATIEELRVLTSDGDFTHQVELAQSLVAGLQTSINTATTTKANLESTIGDAEGIISRIQTATGTATQKETALNGLVATANTLNTSLSNVITTGEQLLSSLNGMVSTANTAKSELNEATTNANTANTNLTGKIQEAQTALTELNEAISGANLDGYISQAKLDNAMATKQDKLPTNGTAGQLLSKTSDGFEWTDNKGTTVVDNLINTSTANALSANQGKILNETKVDKVTGKDLSTYDYDLEAKTKVDAIPNSPEYTDTKYTAGTNITIDENNEISATDTTYTAGTNVSIDANGEISATDTKYTAGANITINESNVISSIDTNYGLASTDNDGLMSIAQYNQLTNLPNGMADLTQSAYNALTTKDPTWYYTTY